MCLDYSPFMSNKHQYILGSGSRDWIIHFYSSNRNYQDFNHLEDHTSSIISIKFGFDPKEKDPSKRLKVISSGADKTIIYRNFDEESKEITLYHKEVFKNNKIVSMDC